MGSGSDLISSDIGLLNARSKKLDSNDFGMFAKMSELVSISEPKLTFLTELVAVKEWFTENMVQRLLMKVKW